MHAMAISEFKTHALRVLGRVEETREPVLITRRGKPVAKVVPYRPEGKKPVPGALAHTLLHEGDILSPLGEAWDADK